MTDNNRPIATLLDRAEEFGKKSLNLLKLNAIDKSSEVISLLVTRLVVIMIVVFSVSFLSIGISIWIGNVLSSVFYGFLIVGGFYAFIALILQLFGNKWLKNCVSNSFIKQMLKSKPNED